MNYQQILQQVNEYAVEYYKLHHNPILFFHNKQHTEYMTGKTVQIANHYRLNDRDFFIVITASWFHDLGYMVDLNCHEEESAKLADAFLRKHNAEEGIISNVNSCIMATKMPQLPGVLLEQIICDADLFHLGNDDFLNNDKLLFKEVNALYNTDISKQDWHRKSIKFLKDHHYHTDYCQVLLNDGKQKNIEKLKRKVAAEEERTSKNIMREEKKHPEILIDYAAVAAQKSKKNKQEKPEKGIETMFRISSSNHQRLSDMADNKAHIMITVNSIILSAIISLLLRRLSDYEYLIIPTFILLSISLLAMTFSILATRPSIPDGTFLRTDVDDKNVNLLFFGNYYKMGLDDYSYGMTKMMEDRDFLYGSLIKDVYAQGVVLGKKYRLLRIAYNIFMFGLIVSVLAFIIASAIFTKL
ncbi:MAG: phosphohydrolase [Mucilaginibacter sp.]|nr:phosphohydrolase [Mucilaginibacter sp.]